MRTRFKKDYYNNSIMGEDGIVKILPELKTMYHFSIEENYFMGDKQAVLRQAIADLEVELERLKELEKKNARALDSWDSISK